MIIDAHHHFWKYDPVAYDWINEEMSVIQRDFLPADLLDEMAVSNIDGVVSVQARQSLQETEWLLEMAATNDFIKGVVGWVPLISATVGSDLEKLADIPKFKSVRHVLQGEPNDDYMLLPDFNRGVALLKKFNVAYDLLIFERHLPQTFQFVDQHPDQVFVLDHIAKPKLAENVFEPWNTNIRKLARRENVFCKLSGLVTEADWKNWTPAQLEPYVNTILEAFGPSRIMFGSDWPVCLVASGYNRWVQTVRHFLKKLSAAEQAQVFGDTATRAYQLF